MVRVSGLAGLHYVRARSGGPGAAIVQKTDGAVPAASSTEVFACTLLSSPSELLPATPLSLTLT
jgi:hypothetical protein